MDTIIVSSPSEGTATGEVESVANARVDAETDNKQINSAENSTHIDPSSTPETQAMTTFINDQGTLIYETPEKTEPSLLHTMDNMHSVTEFLKRPSRIVTMNLITAPAWLTVDPRQDPVPPMINIGVPTDIVRVSSKANKLFNFMYMKADTIIHVVVNASPFSSGKFIVFYAPNDDYVEMRFSAYRQGLTCVSAYPHVIIDISKDTSAILRVPFMDYKEAYNLTNRDEAITYARVYIFPICPIRNISESQSISFQVYGSFDNIVLGGVTQQGLAGVYRSNQQILADAVDNIENLTKGEMKNVLGRFQILETNSTPIRQVASGLSTISQGLTRVPVLSTISRPIEWTSRVFNSALSFFGFSKPIASNKRMNMYVNPCHGMCQAEGEDNSTLLGLNQDSKLQVPSEIFPTNLDEMDIEYVCRNPAIIAVLSTKGDELNWTVRVNCNPESTTIDKVVYYRFTPFWYVVNLFNLWRATVCYKISIAKTPFHRGRLEILFDCGASGYFSESTTENLYRTILDLTTDSEVCIRIPFVSNRLMLRPNELMGVFRIRALGKIVCSNENLDPNIDILVSTWGENVCVAEPISDVFTPAVPSMPSKSNRVSQLIDQLEGKFQISLSNDSECKTVTFFKEVDEQKVNDRVLKMIAGTKITNLRSLTRIFMPYREYNSFDISINCAAPSTDYSSDFITRIEPMYKFFRGGFRLKTEHQSETLRVFSQLGHGVNTRLASSPYHLTFNRLNPIHEISVPFYSRFRRLPIGIRDVTDSEFKTAIISTRTTSTEHQGWVWRASDDDFSMGLLVGVPAMIGKTKFLPG